MRKLVFLFYRGIFSPFLHLMSGPGMGCRFNPTCSQYAEKAIEEWGWKKGSWMALKRLSQCHPWGKA